jgi:uncharacterized LabA/DUF88 family protein
MVNNTDSKITRIAVFFDGAFFLQINSYYKHNHQVGRSFFFSGFMDYIRHKVAQVEHSKYNLCPISEAHWFKARYSANAFENRYPETHKRLEIMTSERKTEDSLVYQGVQMHYTPIHLDNETQEPIDKPVNVSFTAEAVALAAEDRFDVLVIIGGDGEFVHLVNKLNGFGKRVMVLGFNLNFESDNGYGLKKKYIRTSQGLMERCNYSIWMDRIITEGLDSNERLIMGLFNNMA